MKKAVSLLLILALTFVCAFPAASIAEETAEEPTEYKKAAEALAKLIRGMFSGLMGGGNQGDEWADGEDQDGFLYDAIFNGTFWKNDDGGLTLEAVFQDGYYKVAVMDGDRELSYLCYYQDVVEEDRALVRLVGIGTGDAEMDAEQQDHGFAVFQYDYFSEQLTWQRADGEEIVFVRIIDPLDESRWYGDGCLLTIQWQGGLDYHVTIEKMLTSWSYQCALDEEADTLNGVGAKKEYAHFEYENAPASFAFRNGRRNLVWTDEKEPIAADGMTFEAEERALSSGIWFCEPYTVMIAWLDGCYDVQVFGEEQNWAYLCAYDWDDRTLTSMDPATIDFDSFSLYLDKDAYTGAASFTLEDDDTLVWRDDSGLAGDGIAFHKF